MGDRGTKILPDNIKQLRGTDQPCRMNPEAPEPELVCPDPPDYLPKQAAEHFRKTAAQLYELEIISELDVDNLAAYCSSFVSYIELQKEIRKTGIMVKTDQGMILNPLVDKSFKVLAVAQKLACQFGMTPSSRMSVKGKRKKDANPYKSL